MIVCAIRVVTSNMLVDGWETMKNAFGARQKEYEKMIKHGIEAATAELALSHKDVRNIRIEITEVKNASIMVCAYGEIDG